MKLKSKSIVKVEVRYAFSMSPAAGRRRIAVREFEWRYARAGLYKFLIYTGASRRRARSTGNSIKNSFIRESEMNRCCVVERGKEERKRAKEKEHVRSGRLKRKEGWRPGKSVLLGSTVRAAETFSRHRSCYDICFVRYLSSKGARRMKRKRMMENSHPHFARWFSTYIHDTRL